MLSVTVVQPPYHAGEHPDETIAVILTEQMRGVPSGGLIVLPEYSNAGGLSEPDRELTALPHAKTMLADAAAVARENGAYVAINVLEQRNGKIYNSTYLFGKDGAVAFVYDKIQLPPSEVALGVTYGLGSCVCELDGIRFGFMTCYDVYYNEQIEYLAAHKPDIILIPGYQRGERTDIIRAQAKLAAFRCNAYVARSSYSMDDDAHGGCSMIVAPDGQILRDLGKKVGSISTDIDPTWKYTRSAGFGGGMIRNDDFIGIGLRPHAFEK